MFKAIKNTLKRALTYRPLSETSWIVGHADNVRNINLPVCPPYQGDLIFSLITQNGYRRCLETGFHTGSTALYMSAAVGADGHVTSIAIDPDELVNRGLSVLTGAGFLERHTLIRENSNMVLPRMFAKGDTYDFVFMDGWKTFDHLAFEIYFLNQMLRVGGTIMFDDTIMPSVNMAIRLLQRYYDYQEVDYAEHNQTSRLRLFQILTRRSLTRPTRAFRKTRDVAGQLPFRDYTFFRSI